VANIESETSKLYPSWHDVKDPQEITISEYFLKVGINRNNVYEMPVEAKYVGLLHSAIKLAARHPNVQEMSLETTMALLTFIEWCNNIFKEWGFTPAQIAWLNLATAPVNPGCKKEDQRTDPVPVVRWSYCETCGELISGGANGDWHHLAGAHDHDARRRAL